MIFISYLQVNETTHLGDSTKMDELYDIPVGATTTDLPPGVLYRVSIKEALPLMLIFIHIFLSIK